MQQSSKRLFLALGVLALIIVVGGCKKLTPPPITPSVNKSDEAAMKAKEEKAMMEKKAMDAAKPVTLNQQNNSGQTGIAKIYEVEGKAKVSLAISSGASGVPQPAHIHEGTCAKLGPVVFSLTNVVNGASETMLTVPLSSIFNGSSRAINVHKSQAEVSVYVACVDLVSEKEMMEKKDDAMVEKKKDDATMEKQETKTITLTGRNFSFSQNEIRVKKGDTVKVKLTAAEGFHDWVVDEFNAATQQVGTGATTEVQFVANKTGTFEYYCSVGSHRAMGMKGKLIVE